MRGQQQGEQSGEEQSSAQDVLVWNRWGRINDENEYR
jgi:hypothetical protein